MTFLNLLLLSLATWRISSLLVCEDGPGDAFKRLRAAVCRSPFLSGLLSCVWCCSVWVGCGLSLVFVTGDIAERLTIGLSLSAAAIFLQRWMEVQERRINAIR
jgi:hypothetical protein